MRMTMDIFQVFSHSNNFFAISSRLYSMHNISKEAGEQMDVIKSVYLILFNLILYYLLHLFPSDYRSVVVKT